MFYYINTLIQKIKAFKNTIHNIYKYYYYYDYYIDIIIYNTQTNKDIREFINKHLIDNNICDKYYILNFDSVNKKYIYIVPFGSYFYDDIYYKITNKYICLTTQKQNTKTLIITKLDEIINKYFVESKIVECSYVFPTFE